MSSEPGSPALSEEQAREAINRWGDRGFFRLRNMGDKIFVQEIVAGVAYTLRLQTHVERRQVRRAAEPYHGGAVDDRGRPPGPWQVRVATPGPFQERTQTVVIPHTERVQMCPDCSGAGRGSCRACGGQGRSPCPLCAGRGFRDMPVAEPGSSGGEVRTVRQRCSCAGGLVVCPGCGGNGIVRCGTCAGSGQIKTYDQLVVRFLTAKQGEVLDVTPVPDDWLGRLAGDVLVDREEPRIDRCDAGPESVARKAEELLQRSHALDEGHERILLQKLHIERIPLHEVRYGYAGVDRRLWICGAEQAIHAPGAPWNRQRLTAVLAGAVLLAVALVGLIVFLIVR